MPVLDRIELQVIHVVGVVSFIADSVLPEAPLPDTPLATVHSHLGSSFGLWESLGKACLDESPAGREVRVASRQGPDTVQMVR